MQRIHETDEVLSRDVIAKLIPRIEALVQTNCAATSCVLWRPVMHRN